MSFIDKSNNDNMSSFGNYIRAQREQNGLLLREVAMHIGIDTPMLSKVERGVRKLKREKLKKLSKVLQVEEKTLTTLWLAERIYSTLKDEEFGKDALKAAEEELTYHARSSKRKKN